MLHQIINELHKTLTHREWHFLIAAYELGRRQWQQRTPILTALSSHSWAGSTVDNVIDTLTTRKLIDSRRIVIPGTNVGASEIRVTSEGVALVKRCLTPSA